ncbi:phage tail protein [Celeribacter indicus]|uniref:Tail fiber protein n=1 Tax=Celeribacter indicus TaxID=1208324 RepID=A0A0B5DR58_9RHOB|nr:phage tail protein [Celeribacter indicus]AJE46003.1 hypothetical protein P73_1288 [Celeribacter indicus]SDX32635.1 hypothetical protein SAMN05443573_1223 [Celeribacter indicus]
MSFTEITPYGGQFPSSDDPASFDLRARELMSWLVANFAPEVAALSVELATALDGASSVLEAIAGGAMLPIGGEIFWTGTTLPDGFLEENGGAHERALYPRLWAHAQASGMFDPTGDDPAMFGPGDGSTTFTLPDARAEFLRVWDHGRGVDAGRALGSSQAEALGAHTHDLTVRSWQRNTDGGTTDRFDLNSGGGSTVTTSETGGEETRPRNVARMLIIRAR